MHRRHFARLALLGIAGFPILTSCGGVQPYVPVAPRWRGADISFTLQEEAAGTLLTDDAEGKQTSPIEVILARSGATAARLRLWVDPPTGYSDRESLLALARRVHAAGLEILLDLHYSDFWADQTSQTTPVAWQGQPLAQLAETVRQYTAGVLVDLNAQGTPATLVQIGNEVTNGILWPTGQVYSGSGGEEWSGFGTLLKAGLQGVADVPGPLGPPSTMVHIQGIDNLEATRYTLDHIFDQGVETDLIGLSYYPFWHGSLGTLGTALSDLAGRYGKGLVIAETSYPWTLNADGENGLFVDSTGDLPDAARFPPTPAGQTAYFKALKELLSQVPNGLGAGYFAWEPGWLPGVGVKPDEPGDPYANLTMFDYSGVALPALAEFSQSLG